MRNKIVFVKLTPEENHFLEKVFYPFIQEGGEIFSVSTPEEAYSLFEREHPLLFFMDFPVLQHLPCGNSDFKEKVVALVDRDISAPPGLYVRRPLVEEEILRTCQAFLVREPVEAFPPM